jgi:ubiquinone/menaquinone biosynthesis C-methylase UbiE
MGGKPAYKNSIVFMQATAHYYQPFQQPTQRFTQLTDCLTPLKNREINEWTLEQLGIQPYQQILEVNYGSGSALQEAARKLKVGFLAGVDPSASMYQLAYRRNKKFIGRQLLQLHLGEIRELPYPSHYFHTIYGINVRFLPKDRQPELLRLATLLKNGGKLVLVFQSRKGTTEPALRLATEKLQADYEQAGLIGVRLDRHDRFPGICIAATGFKI